MPNSELSMPELPWVANDESMLTRKFGKEVVNYYAGGSLNRYSFLRPDTGFLRRAAVSYSSRYLVLNNLNALITGESQLAYLTFEEVKPLIGAEPFSLTEDECVKQYDSTKSSALIVFLGTHEGAPSETLDSTEHGAVRGQAYFAVDATPRGSLAEAATAFLKAQEEKGRKYQSNPRNLTLNAEAAAAFAQARSIVDWNSRNSFCAGCGNRNLSVHAGYKRVCPPTDAGAATPEQQQRGDCPTRHGISNVCFPRTDPTMIAAVVSADGQRVLLGRQVRFPPYWYSTLAGFLEPGESIEEAVRREVWEEAGVRVGRVVIHSSQPWPYPSSLMIGAIAQALPGGETINLNDKELEAAKWFTMDEARQALKTGTSALGGDAPAGYQEGALRLPPGQAIANQLITAVASGFLASGSKI